MRGFLRRQCDWLMKWSLFLVEAIVRQFLINTPTLVLRLVPHGSSLVSLLYLYVFAQALGLLWSFVIVVAFNNVLAAWSWAERQCTWKSAYVMCGSIDSIPMLALRVYASLAVMRVLWFLGRGLWLAGWESYLQYPWLRRLLKPRSFQSGSFPLRNTRAIQRGMMIAPLYFICAMTTGLTFLPLACEHPMAAAFCAESYIPLQLGSGTTRFSRMSKFCLFVAILQWSQFFQSIFPTWHEAILHCKGTSALACRLLLLSLVPVTLFRVVTWAVMPLGTLDQISVLGFVVGHHRMDSMLLLVWTFTLILASRAVLSDNAAVSKASWQKALFTDEAQWSAAIQRNHLIFILPMLFHYVRGIATPHMGLVFAQSDNLLITTLYPFVLVLVWWGSYLVTVVPSVKLHLLAHSLLLPALLACYLADRMTTGAVLCMWAHLSRQLFKLLSKWKAKSKHVTRTMHSLKPGSPKPSSSSRPAAHTDSLNHSKVLKSTALGQVPPSPPPPSSPSPTHPGGEKTPSSPPSSPSSPARRSSRAASEPYKVYFSVAQIALRLGFGLVAWVVLTGTGLSFLSFVQREKQLFPSKSMMTLEHSTLHNTRIRHAVLQLDLISKHANAEANTTHGGVGGAGSGRQAEAMTADKGERKLCPASQAEAGGHPCGAPEPAAVAGVGTLDGLPSYAICDMRPFGLSTVDYGILAVLSYMPPEKAGEALQNMFPNGWDVKVANVKAAVEDEEAAFWTEFTVNETMSVVAVKGTEFWRFSDYVEDLIMWMEPVTISLVSLVLPSLRTWSPKTVGMFIDCSHELQETLAVPNPPLKYERLVRYLEDLRKRKPSQHIVLTGHSLGGGIAFVASAIEGLPAVAFSPPGVYNSISKYLFRHSKHNLGPQRLGVEAVHNRTVSIISENDWVAKLFDAHGGLVQTITCNTDQFAMFGCHMAENSVCNLIRHCHSEAPHHTWADCNFKYTSDTVHQWATDLYNQSVSSSYMERVVQRKTELVYLACSLAGTVLFFVLSSFAELNSISMREEKSSSVK